MYDKIIMEIYLFSNNLINEFTRYIKDNSFDPNWLTAIATFLLAIVALFQEYIISCFWKPILDISRDLMSTPYSIEIQKKRKDKSGAEYISDSIYFRLGINNEKGNRQAKNVEVYAKALYKKNNSTFFYVPSFFPTNLLWTDHKKPYKLHILPKVERLCNIGHIIDPSKRGDFDENPIGQKEEESNNIVFWIEVETPLNSKGHIIGPGEYELHLLIGASNANQIKKKIALKIPRQWDSSLQGMKDYGLDIHLVD